MKIECIFRGKNSLGYENGKKYNLFVDSISMSGTFTIQDTNPVYVQKGQRCEYSNIRSFTNNWEITNTEYDPSLYLGKDDSHRLIKNNYNKYIQETFGKYIRDKKLEKILSE